MPHKNTITSTLVPEGQRAGHTGKLFGTRWVFVESFCFDNAGGLSSDYDGGLWNFYSLSNGGFYMAPSAPDCFKVECANGFGGQLSADALGITACLYSYSHLSFSPDEAFAELCATHFHRLREFMLEHLEANSILRAID